jgi:hypothetical protein
MSPLIPVFGDKDRGEQEDAFSPGGALLETVTIVALCGEAETQL